MDCVISFDHHGVGGEPAALQTMVSSDVNLDSLDVITAVSIRYGGRWSIREFKRAANGRFVWLLDSPYQGVFSHALSHRVV